MPIRTPFAPLAAFLLTALLALSAQSREFTDSAGRHVALPDRIARVATAGPTADVLVFALAPDRMIGWSRAPQRPFLPGRAGHLRVTGLALGPDSPDAAATVMRLRPDLVIAAGMVTPARAAMADQLQQSTGVPCILVDDSVSRMPGMLRSIGAVLGVTDRAEDLATYAEHAVNAIRGRLLIEPSQPRPRVYYARGPNGLETALPGSPAADALEEAGAINVAAGLGRDERVAVSVNQVQGWAPEIVIAEQRGFYQAAQRDPAWRRIPAVASHRIYLAPSSPFGWIDDPPGINRLIGLYWLSDLLYRDATQEDLRDTVREFYDTFYRIKLSEAQLTEMLKPAEPARSTDPMEALLGIAAVRTPAGSLPLTGLPPAGRHAAMPPATAPLPADPLPMVAAPAPAPGAVPR